MKNTNDTLVPETEAFRWTFIALALVGVYFGAFALLKNQRITHAAQDV